MKYGLVPPTAKSSRARVIFAWVAPICPGQHSVCVMLAYVATTDEIRVSVRPVYLDGQSDVLAHRFVFAYFIRIENRGMSDVQLLRRHWYITNNVGSVQEVEGEGVIGEQPVIAPGAAHEYNSYTVIDTFEGHMHGTYLMERAKGQRFRVEIPRFDLRALAN